MLKRWYFLPLLFLALYEFLTLYLQISRGIFYFTFDAARDAIWVNNQLEFKKLSLIGPWASLQGVYFGPLWFWLLAIPHFFSGGNPTANVYFNAAIIYISAVTGAFLIRKQNKTIAYFFLIAGFLSPALHGLAGFAFPSHLLPLFTFLLLFSLIKFALANNFRYLYLSAFFTSLMFHAEPPAFIFSLVFLMAYLIYLRYRSGDSPLRFTSLRMINIILIFIIPFIPQILFEMRHNWLQTKSVITYLFGQNQSLGDILPFSQRLINRPAIFFQVFEDSIFKASGTVALLILIFSVMLNFKNKNKFVRKFYLLSIFYIFTALVLFIIYPPELKKFYLDGIQIIFLFWLAVAFGNLWKKAKTKKIAVAAAIIVLFWFNNNPINYVKSVKSDFSELRQDTGIYANQIAVVDWIYQAANGKGFKAYVYQPAVYDLAYQYLFLWYGLKKYGFLPEEFSYLPGVPEYVPQKSNILAKYSGKIKKSHGTTFLIIEKDFYEVRATEWLKKFPKDEYALLEKKSFVDGTVVEKRSNK